MSRETRLNLIFLAVLLVALAPGAVMFVRKKAAPDARPMALPDPVFPSAAYNDAVQTNPTLRRIVPQETADWVHAMARAHQPTPTTPPITHYEQGLIAQQRGWEIAAWAVEPAGKNTGTEAGTHATLRVDIVTWGRPWTGQLQAVRWRVNQTDAQAAGHDTVAVPTPVRHELQNVGFVDPPAQVGWVELSAVLPAAELAAGARLTISAGVEDAGRMRQDVVTLTLPTGE